MDKLVIDEIATTIGKRHEEAVLAVSKIADELSAELIKKHHAGLLSATEIGEAMNLFAISIDGKYSASPVGTGLAQMLEWRVFAPDCVEFSDAELEDDDDDGVWYLEDDDFYAYQKQRGDNG